MHNDKSPNNGKANPYDNVKESAQFSVLRQAVWTRVARTIMTQEEVSFPRVYDDRIFLSSFNFN